MTIVIAAVLADGDIADEEALRIRAMCSLSPVFASNSGDQDKAVINFALNKNKQLGDQAVSSAGEGLSPELRETAFAFACDMVMADGFLGAGEEAFLENLVTSLNIASDRARAIIDVTLIRNRQ